MKKGLIILVVALQFLGSRALAQNKSIVVLGSSTAAGTGANPYDSSWAGRLQLHYRQNTNVGDPDTVVTNLALGGQYTFSIMPTGYIFPNGYPQVNTARNITQAISLNPDVIIINLPSNDQVWPFPNWQSMNNFRTIYNEAQLNNKRCFISTTQPVNHSNLNVRDSLRKMVDSIKNNFGYFAIDFWTPLASPTGDSSIRADLNSDGTHVNNLGHRLLFQQVIAKDLFPTNSPLPLKLVDFSAQLQSNYVVLKWRTTEEEPNSFFEIERSKDGREFSKLHSLNATGTSNVNDYTWKDQQPLEGKNFYRLKITEPTKISYSKTIGIANKGKQLSISSAYVDGGNLNIKISSNKNETVEISIINLTGMLVKKMSQQINNNGSNISVTVSELAAGEYILRISNAAGDTDTERFIKLK